MRFSSFNLFLVFSFLGSTVHSQTLFTYGGKPVSVQSFQKAFNKNPEPGNPAKAMEAYLPLYINYQLKVQDAYDKKLDTLPSQKEELGSYKQQLAANFLSNKNLEDVLVEEAWERSKSDLKLQHLMIGFSPGDANSLAKAQQLAMEAHAALKSGQAFKTVVDKYSTDSENKQSAGELGWITVFSLPYVYENEIYKLPKSGITQPIQGSNAFHIFKKIDSRPAVGKISVSQIRIQPSALLGASEIAVQKKIDSIYLALKGGADFANLARQFSTDRSSSANGGKLPPFGIGQYDESFQDKAFKLSQAEPISQPFKTEYGWHILKLEEKLPVTQPLETVLEKGDLKNKVITSERVTLAKGAYVQKLLPKLSYKAANINQSHLWSFTDSALKGRPAKVPNTIKATTTVFLLGKKPFTADDWVQYVRTIRFSGGAQATATYDKLFETFLVSEAEHYVRENLENIDAASATLLKEYKDANLLFEAMERNVWSKASAETEALEAYYQKNRNKYIWAKSAEALVLSTRDSGVVVQGLQALKTNPNDWRKWVDNNPETLVWDSGRYEIDQLPGQKQSQIKQGSILSPIKRTHPDEPFSFAYVFTLRDGGDTRSFDEARGFVTNDYQQVIENEWLKALKKKYPVKINEPVWQALLKKQ